MNIAFFRPAVLALLDRPYHGLRGFGKVRTLSRIANP